MIQLINVGSGGGGGGGNVTELLTPGTLGQTFADLAGGTSVTIPAGAYRIMVWNTGVVNITVAGAPVAPGEKWELHKEENRSTTKVDFCPAVSIAVPSGGAAQYQVITPS